jgi:hypothetical protein
VELGDTANDTCEVLSQACGGEAIKESSESEWNKLFNEDRFLKSQMKKMLIIFCSIKGITHFEFITQGQTVNQAYYV